MSPAAVDSKYKQPLEVLPHELFEQFILPDLLSHHLHALLIDPDPQTWNAFKVLPLVSKSFYKTCDSLFSKMFGTKRRVVEECAPTVEDSDDFDDFDNPDDYDPSRELDYATSIWKRARCSGSRTASSHSHTSSYLLGSATLIRVYTCLAIGKMFLNADVLRPLGLPALEETDAGRQHKLSAVHGRRTAWDEDYEEQSYERFEPTALDDGKLHQCRMPFECAQLICDSIMPTRLAYAAADYMGRNLPLYYMLPSVAKWTSDLKFNVTRKYILGFGLEEYTEFAVNTLYRLENAEQLLKVLMSRGTLVQSFWNERRVPITAMKELTGVITALDDVRRADWGSDTAATRSRASALILRWTA